MVLDDSVFESMSLEQWQKALAPKTHGARNLHVALTSSPLDFFIIMSSAVALGGMPAFAINVGAVRDVGFVAENPAVAASMERQGFWGVSVNELLALLDFAVVNQPRDHAVTALGIMPPDAANVKDLGSRGRLWAHLRRRGDAATAGSKSAGSSSGRDGDDVLSLLSAATDKVDAVCQAILVRLGKLIATPVEALSPDRNLDSYVDSLVAVELRNWIAATLKANIQLMVLRGAASIAELAGVVVNESRLFEGA